MNVLFILENTINDLHGGTEVSSYHLARLLRREGVLVEEWSPYKKRRLQYWYTGFIFQLYTSLLLREIGGIRFPDLLAVLLLL